MRVLLVCLVVGCGSAPKPGTASHSGFRTPEEVGIRADRAPVSVRELRRGAQLAPEPVEYEPVLQTLPYQGDDIDGQIAMRERLVAAQGDSVDRVEQLVAIASLYIQKGERNRAERAYIRAANESDFSKYEHADEVLFRAAMLLRGRGELKQALRLFYTLIKNYPASSWIADAYVQFGDYFFERDENDNATKFYSKAVQLAEKRTLAYARYKLGWCHLRQKNHEGALEQFVLALQQTNGKDSDMHRAALRAFVYSYPGGGRPDRAYGVLRRLDADRAADLFAWLGEVYAARNMDDESAEVFAQLAKLVDEGKTRGAGVSTAFSARARRQLEAGRTVRAEQYIERFPDVADAGEIAYYLADAAWRRAARAQDLGVAGSLWQRTAALFERAIDLGGLGPDQIVDAEAAATVARSNARVLRQAQDERD